VRGSVEEDVDGSAGVVDGDALVVVAVLDAEVLDEEVVADELEDELDDELEDVEVGADGCVLVELEWLPEPDEPELPSGSTYCWSPAEPPPATAAAGASIRRAAIATIRPRIWRRQLTRRVLHRVVSEVADPARRVRARIRANSGFAGFIASAG
jgi:hypothetical protein